MVKGELLLFFMKITCKIQKNVVSLQPFSYKYHTRMKKTLFLLLLTLTATTSLHAYDFQVGCFHYNITNDTLPPFTVELAKLEDEKKKLREIVIPETIAYHDTTYVVTRIGRSAFYQCAHITSITLPYTITSIGEEAFAFCKGLTEIIIPDSVQYIESSAFERCGNLTSVVIPKQVSAIGSRAFMKCSQLSSIAIPESVNNIGRDAFKDTPWYNSLPDGVVYINNVLYAYKGNTMMANTAIKVRNGTTAIGDYAFENCTGLTSIALPKTIKTIGAGAFYNCSALTSIVIPKGVKHIEHNTFKNCSFLARVLLPEGLTDIGHSAFQGCKSLVSINIPQTLQRIGDCAFLNCYMLKDVYLSEGVTDIGGNAFNNCRSLTSITIPNSVVRFGPKLYIKWADGSIHVGVFMDCVSLQFVHIGNGISTIPAGTFCGCTALTSVYIPNGVTTIGESAFQNCTHLSSVEIPRSVKKIGVGAFSNCTFLSSVSVLDSVDMVGFKAFENTPWYYAQKNGEVYIGKTLYAYKGEMPRNTFVHIQEGTTYIADSAFANCVNLVGLTLPNTITHIGSQAFRDCKNLMAVTIPDSTNIGNSAFLNCKKLKEIIIPKSVTNIGFNAFYETPWFRKFPNGFVYINNVLYARKGEGTQPKSYVVKEGTVSISLYVFLECEWLKSVTLPASLRSIDPPIFSCRIPPEYVVCLATAPPVGLQHVFSAKRLYVPDSAVEAYKAVMDEYVEILPLSEKPNE